MKLEALKTATATLTDDQLKIEGFDAWMAWSDATPDYSELKAKLDFIKEELKGRKNKQPEPKVEQ